MPLLNPNGIDNILEAAGLTPSRGKRDKNAILQYFEQAGFGLEEICQALVDIANNAPSENSRRETIKLIMQSIGVLQPENMGSQTPQITLVFNTGAANAADLSFVNPPIFDNSDQKEKEILQ